VGDYALSAGVAADRSQLSLNVALAESARAFADADALEADVWEVAVDCLRGLLGAATTAWHHHEGSAGFALLRSPGSPTAGHDGAEPWAMLSQAVPVDRIQRFDPMNAPDAQRWGEPTDRHALRSFLSEHNLVEGLLIPIVSRRRPLGLLLAARGVGDPGFSPSDQVIASHVAGCAAIALDRSRLVEQLRARVEVRAQGSRSHDPLGILNLLTDAVVTTELTGTVIGWNPSAEHLYGISERDAIGRRLSHVLPTSPIGPWTMRSMRDHLRRTRAWRGELEQITGDGRHVRVLASATVIEDPLHGRPIIVTILHDDSEWQNLLERHETLSTSMLDALPSPTALVDSNGRIEAVNQAWRHSMLVRGGSDRGCGVGANYLQVCSVAADSGDPMATRALEGLASVLRGDQSTFTLQYESAANTHDVSWFSMRVSPVRGGGAVVSHHDVTRERAIADQLAHAAAFDDLTGLPNQLSLAKRLENLLLASDQEPGTRTGVLFVDISRFRIVNDSLGRRAGDKLLRRLARRIEAAVGEDDYLGRVGGDVFAVLARRSDREQFTDLAARISYSIARPLMLGSRELELMSSIGVALATPGCDAESLLGAAHRAVHRSKDWGAGRAAVLDVGDSPASATLDAELELRSAIGGGQLELDYQAMVDVDSRSITGFEALVRWNHPTRGRLGPDSFIPLAEDTNLIVPLGAWVLDAAIATASSWPVEQSVAVNVSPVQIANTDLAQMVKTVLERHDFDPYRLILEVTESILVRDDREMIEQLELLRTFGVRVAIDDFGTGFSSFSYLHSLPVDIIKIDKLFIDRLPGPNEAVVAAIIGLAVALGFEVIAEGIEHEEQLHSLERLGCRCVQGFLLHQPAPAADLCEEPEAC
jgi:diguanylate cyclase (GGDEF)-like protein/PAS domain S-box-containing protein